MSILWWDLELWFQQLLIDLVTGIFKIVSYAYQIFLVLAKTNIFEQKDYMALTEKIYVILGVVMMFVIAYNILTFIIDPDKNKGGAAVEKMLKNIVISFILIVLCPTIFNYAFKVQDAILEQGIFTRFFSNANGFDGNTSIKQGGNIMAAYTFTAFFTPKDGIETEAMDICKSNNRKCKFYEARNFAVLNGEYGDFRAFAGNAKDDKMEFNWLIALVCGGYLIYVIVSFCFDLAVRIVKLAFYQIIAPICIACRILPEKDSIYKNWWKAVSKTYLSVFIRVVIMNLGVYLITIFVGSNFFEKNCDDCSPLVQTFAYALIILGIVTFIKQSSKLLDEIFGFGDVKLGIKEKLAEGGAFTAGAMVGGGLTTGVRNLTHAVGNVKKAEGAWGKIKAVGSGARSVVHGSIAGGIRGAKAGWKAASASDMARAASSAAQKTTEKRDEREAYRASHKSQILDGKPVLRGIAEAAGLGLAEEAVGRVKDAGFAVGRWAGVNNTEELERENSDISRLADEVSSVADMAKSMLESKAAAGKTYTFGIPVGEGADSSAGSTYRKISSKVTKNSIAFSMDNIRKFKDAIAESQRTGESVKLDILDGGVSDFNAEELSRIYGKYLSDYSKRVADVAFLSDNNYKTTIGALGLDEQAAISDVHSKADKARESVRSALGSEVLKTANEEAVKKGRVAIDVKNIDGDLQFSKDGALDKIKPAADIVRGKNQEKINEIRQKENNAKDKK